MHRPRVSPIRASGLAIALALAWCAPAAVAQLGTALTGDPGGFGIDGELQANAPANTSDWVDWFAGTGVGFLMPNGTPTSAATLHSVDAYNNSDLIFSSTSSRHFEDPNTAWAWDTPGVNPLGGKENINNVVVHLTRAADGHTWFTWSVDRRGGGGESYMDVVLCQSILTRNGNGTFSSAGPHGGHTVGDVILSLQIFDPNTLVPILTAWRWTEISPGVYDYTSLSPTGGTFFTGVNLDMTPVPYGAFGDLQYSPETFAEASIDLSALLAAIQPGASFQTLLFCSRFGASIGSVLKDFVEPIQRQITTDVPAAPGSGMTGITGLMPNPATGPVTVEFDLARAGPATLQVFDVAGRRVGKPVGGTFAAGRHTLRWEPDGGLAGRGGVFYARLETEARTFSRRFVRLP